MTLFKTFEDFKRHWQENFCVEGDEPFDTRYKGAKNLSKMVYADTECYYFQKFDGY